MLTAYIPWPWLVTQGYLSNIAFQPHPDVFPVFGDGKEEKIIQETHQDIGWKCFTDQTFLRYNADESKETNQGIFSFSLVKL